MKKEYPMTVAQEAVLKRLGLLNEVRGFTSAKTLLAELGLEASYDRQTKNVEAYIVDRTAGGFNAYGEGETWTIDTRKVDLEPIREWIKNPERMPKKPEPTPPAPESDPFAEADNGYDFERDAETQAEIDADAAMTDDESAPEDSIESSGGPALIAGEPERHEEHALNRRTYNYYPADAAPVTLHGSLHGLWHEAIEAMHHASDLALRARRRGDLKEAAWQDAIEHDAMVTLAQLSVPFTGFTGKEK